MCCWWRLLLLLLLEEPITPQLLTAPAVAGAGA
jgi:hypothetical protein